MNFFTSFLFWIFINVWAAVIPIIYFPVFFLKGTKFADHGALIWSRFSLWVLKKLCGINYQIIGLEKLPKTPFIVACKHQSMWETIVMHLVFNRPVYTYKKELLMIPFYGWFLRRMSAITIDRKGGAMALKNLIRQAKEYLAKNQVLIIFPQGTRVPVGGSVEKYPYHSGITALYFSCNVPVVPAALNSGIYWGKKTAKKSGIITLEFLNPIETGLSKNEFNDRLQQKIEDNSQKLLDLVIKG
jgi:1-acyl-sn-glycerol-3-phosphate acyltransferase